MNLTTPVTAKLAAIAGVACLAVGLAGGAAVGSWLRGLQADADIAQLKADHKTAENQWLADKNAITQHAQQETAAALERERQARDAAAEADRAAQEKLTNVEAENDRLRNDVANGNKRVRILAANLATAELAARQHAAGGNTGGSTVGDDLQIDLSPEGGRAVLDLRESTEKDDAVIQYLQGYIRNVVKQCKR